jgi:Plavaka transposase
MTVPEVVRCPDGHFRRAVYSIGPVIADYPEQVWLSGIVQGWCPKSVISSNSWQVDQTHLFLIGVMLTLMIWITETPADELAIKRTPSFKSMTLQFSGLITEYVTILL